MRRFLALGPLPVLPCLVACGGELSGNPGLEQVSESGGNESVGGATGTGGAEMGWILGDTEQSPWCPVEEVVDAPAPLDGCRVDERTIDPADTCGGEHCPITRVLDLDCAVSSENPSIAVTSAGVVVAAGGLFMTVSDAGTSIQPVVFPDISEALIAADGAGWGRLFARRGGQLVTFRQTDERWLSALREPYSLDFRLSAAVWVDDQAAYMGVNHFDGPHLQAWDGSCWHDELLSNTATGSVTVAADAAGRPWVAWDEEHEGTQRVHLRRPDGSSEPVFAGTSDPFHPVSIQDWRSPRVLPGGLDGGSELPAIVSRFGDGVHVITAAADGHSGWVGRGLDDTLVGATSGNCPPTGRAYGSAPCEGLATCTEQVTGASRGFGFARTQSGSSFAAWVVYATQASYALEEYVAGGEMMLSECQRIEALGSGTANLVVARITDEAITPTVFRFDIGGAVSTADHGVTMVARGETLLIAATLPPDTAHSLTYFEIDSTELQ